MEAAAVEIFNRHRGQLMALGYRMMGSLSEAEDLVQETYLRWQEAAPQAIENPKSWLTKVCSRLCIDQLRKAYRQREEYAGPWLPEPLPNAFRPWPEPESPAETSESLSIAFLLILEKLSPMERAVFLLHDVFNYTFKEVAAFVEGSEEQCRKLGQRAREAIQRERPRFDQPDPESFKVLERFFSAARNGEEAVVQELLAADSEFWSDGGGKVPAAMKILDDPATIAKFLLGLGRLAKQQHLDFKSDFTMVNDRPGMLLARRQADGHYELETVFAFEFRGGKISRIYAMRNPDKLQAWRGSGPEPE
ncbi:MAG TPA: RNA polymerase sigma factor SigJ [bacterium]|nr:RNA polymerase sigma factor SigJ [bacterium]